MTKMALGWVEHLERVRSDKAQETETHRANQQREWETHRSNVANEMLQSRNIDELERSNRAKENEAFRHNVAVEQETKRSNVASEAIRAEQNSINYINAQSQQLQAQVAQQNANTRYAELLEKEAQRNYNYSATLREIESRERVASMQGQYGLGSSALGGLVTQVAKWALSG